MSQRPGFRRRILRFLISLALLAMCVVLMLAVRHFVIQAVLSSGSSSDFSAVVLSKGLARQAVVDQLGPPDIELTEPSKVDALPSVLLGYVRGKHSLELTFVDDKLTDWVETRPLDLESLDQARTGTIPCCAPAEDAPRVEK